MATEQHIRHQLALNGITPLGSMEKSKYVPSPLDELEDSPAGGFDCNICLDSVQDPVVTFCGHLYCWPCIYKWINYQTVSSESPDQQPPQCPVCKAEVSKKTLIPLYGRGGTTRHEDGKTQQLGIVIPQRPPSPRCGGHMPIASTNTDAYPPQEFHHQSYPQQPLPYQPYPNSFMASSTLNLGGTTTSSVFQPMIGMFGDMVSARISGNSETTIYTYPSSYNQAGYSSPRMRRQMMQADKSLSRISFFLFCCVIFCLFLF